MRRILAFLLTILICLFPLAALAEADTAHLAETVLAKLAQGDCAAVFEDSDEAMQEALGSADGLAAVWAQLTGTLGALESVQATDAGAQGDYRVAVADCVFANADATLTLAFDAQGRLGSLGLTAMRPHEDSETADEGGYIEEAITLREGEEDATSGLLTLPEGEGPFPAVVMVHGSGPSDMDESAYACAPFRDLAHGLARLGVASIRYDKYTYAHPENCLRADFTVDDEYTRDALDAAKLLMEDARIGDIYLLGHSQGAMLAPRIMAAMQKETGDRLRGGVLLAGSPLPMWELQYHQNLDVLAGLSGETLAENEALIEAEVAKVPALADMSAEELQKQTLFGISVYYQADEMSVDAVQTAVALDLPLFIAQGGKDWQVRPADGIEAWQSELPQDFDAAYALYPDMTHLLFDLESAPSETPADYLAADARVSEALIEDIAAWIAAH